MMKGRTNVGTRRSGAGAVVLALIAILASSVAAEGAEPGNSAATITASFSDSCTDFEAHSGKDISHVEIRYADGRVVKDESIDSPDYSIDGDAGDEIDSAIVKSGTTTERFDCAASNSPPGAVLEIKTPAEPIGAFDGGLVFDGLADRTDWTSADAVQFCFFFSCTRVAGGCVPCPPDSMTVHLRGTSSTDRDGDIVSWSIDFGDGTFTGPRDWATDPPAEVSHTYPNSPVTVALTVTDSAGQSGSDSMNVHFNVPD
jgi:hypothetical protein